MRPYKAGASFASMQNDEALLPVLRAAGMGPSGSPTPAAAHIGAPDGAGTQQGPGGTGGSTTDMEASGSGREGAGAADMGGPGTDARARGTGQSGTSMAQEQPGSTKASSTEGTAGRTGRLLVVANRLPVTVTKSPEGQYSYKMSSGGLVSALLGVRGRLPFLWLGWLGKEIEPEDQDRVRAELLEQHGCVPVFLPAQLAEDHYNGFSNDVLWPLLHYESQLGGVIGPAFLGGASAGLSAKTFETRLWAAYKQANKAFAEVVAGVYRPGDSVWVHDYHLMVCPFYLRRVLPAQPRPTIAWFLHTPWPASDIYRVLPVRSDIMRGLLECDLLGFHTHDYARHFLACAPRVLPGVQAMPAELLFKGRSIRVGVFPIGIEPESFVAVQQTPAFAIRLEQLGAFFAAKRLIVAVDRLDPIKGIPHRLLGFETFLHRWPEWRGKVTLLQVAVPSRTDVPAYQALAAACSTLVGRINGTFGSLDWAPVQYLFKSVDPTELTVLYSLADVCLITSLRDGMNLVSEEFVACTARANDYRHTPGVLLLSEFAGSAQSLAGAVRCNPWDTNDIASAIHRSLVMDDQERSRRHALLNAYVSTYTSAHWAVGFVDAMQKAGDRARSITGAGASTRAGPEATVEPAPGAIIGEQPQVLPVEPLLRTFEISKSRLIVVCLEDVLPWTTAGLALATGPAGSNAVPMAANGKALSTSPDIRDPGRASAVADVSLGTLAGLTFRSQLTAGTTLGSMGTANSLGSAGPQTDGTSARQLLNTLCALAAQSRNRLVLVSHRLGMDQMSSLLADVPEAILVAEGGALIRLPTLMAVAKATALATTEPQAGANTSQATASGSAEAAGPATGTGTGRRSFLGMFTSRPRTATGTAGTGTRTVAGTQAASHATSMPGRPLSAPTAMAPSLRRGLLQPLRTDVGTTLTPLRLLSPGGVPLAHASPGTPVHAIRAIQENGLAGAGAGAWSRVSGTGSPFVRSSSSSHSGGNDGLQLPGPATSAQATAAPGHTMPPAAQPASTSRSASSVSAAEAVPAAIGQPRSEVVRAVAVQWWATAPGVVGAPLLPKLQVSAQVRPTRRGPDQATPAQGQATVPVAGPQPIQPQLEHRVSAVDLPVPIESEKPGAPTLPPPAAPAASIAPAGAPAGAPVGAAVSDVAAGPAGGQAAPAKETAQKSPTISEEAPTGPPAPQSPLDWKVEIRPLLSHYAILTPGAFVEESDNSVAFHYEGADPEQGTWAARELLNHLQASTASVPLEIVMHGSPTAMAGSGYGVTGMGSGMVRRTARRLQVRVRGTGLANALALITQSQSAGRQVGRPGTETPALRMPLDFVLALTDASDSAGFGPALAALQDTGVTEAGLTTGQYSGGMVVPALHPEATRQYLVHVQHGTALSALFAQPAVVPAAQATAAGQTQAEVQPAADQAVGPSSATLAQADSKELSPEGKDTLQTKGIISPPTSGVYELPSRSDAKELLQRLDEGGMGLQPVGTTMGQTGSAPNGVTGATGVGQLHSAGPASAQPQAAQARQVAVM